MSKKFEIKSCHMCPNYSTYDHNYTTYDVPMAQCSGYADGDTIVGRVFEDVTKDGYIWEECPLEDYHAEEYDFKSSVPVINRHALNKACGTSKNIVPVRQALAEARAETVTPAELPEPKVEMTELVILVECSSYTEYYYAPDGNSHISHPAKLNEFIHRVSESGGNILSVQIMSDQLKYSVHYQVPVGTYPISI